MTAPGSHLDDVRGFYDQWSTRFVAGFGTTFQAGFLKPDSDADEDPELSNHLLAARAGVQADQRILDAGCGVGGPAIAMAAGFSGVTVCGLTISAVQTTLARQLAMEAGVAPRVSILQGDYHRLPFADDRFDVAVFFESTGYSPDRPRLFREAARVVRPGGRIYVKDVFARAPVTTAQQAGLQAFDRLWHLASSPTIAEVEAALRRAGCQILSSGDLANVGSARFLRAMVDFDPDTIFRVNALGRAFLLETDDIPTFFGEVLARLPD